MKIVAVISLVYAFALPTGPVLGLTETDNLMLKAAFKPVANHKSYLHAASVTPKNSLEQFARNSKRTRKVSFDLPESSSNNPYAEFDDALDQASLWLDSCCTGSAYPPSTSSGRSSPPTIPMELKSSLKQKINLAAPPKGEKEELYAFYESLNRALQKAERLKLRNPWFPRDDHDVEAVNNLRQLKFQLDLKYHSGDVFKFDELDEAVLRQLLEANGYKSSAKKVAPK